MKNMITLALLALSSLALAQGAPAPLTLTFSPSVTCPAARAEVRTIDGGLEAQQAVLDLGATTRLTVPRSGPLKLVVTCVRGDVALGGRTVIWKVWPQTVQIRGGQGSEPLPFREVPWGGEARWGFAPSVTTLR